LIKGIEGTPSQREELIAEKIKVPLKICYLTRKYVGLSFAADRSAGTYSGGMRRRLSVAVASMGDPRVIFLDEVRGGGGDSIGGSYLTTFVPAGHFILLLLRIFYYYYCAGCDSHYFF
jgi:hypothetical protein